MNTKLKCHNFSGKHLLSLLFILCWLNTSLFAQEAYSGTEGKGLSYGLKLGMNSSNFTKQQLNAGSKLGFSAGGFLNYTFPNTSKLKFLSTQAELLYMQQGGITLTDELVSSSYDVKTINNTTFHNIEIPVLIKLGYPGLTSPIQPKLFFGPALGINMAANNRYTSAILFDNGHEFTVKGNEDVTSEYNKLQWGAYVGVGGDVHLKSTFLTIDVRYRLGMNPVVDNYDTNDIIQGFGEMRSNTLAVTVGLGF